MLEVSMAGAVVGGVVAAIEGSSLPLAMVAVGILAEGEAWLTIFPLVWITPVTPDWLDTPTALLR